MPLGSETPAAPDAAPDQPAPGQPEPGQPEPGQPAGNQQQHGSPASTSPAFEGYIDFYGYHEGAGGWFFAGWVTHSWTSGARPHGAVARFPGEIIADHEASIFYRRADVSDRGIGFVFFLRAASRNAGAFIGLDVQIGGATRNLYLAHQASHMYEAELEAYLQIILAETAEGPPRQKMQKLLLAGRSAPPVGGFIDFYGYHNAAGGWLLCGWVAQSWPEGTSPGEITIVFETGYVRGQALGVLFERPELQGVASGAMFFVPGPAPAYGAFCALGFEVEGVRFSVSPSRGLPRLREAELCTRLAQIISLAPPCADRDRFRRVLARRPFAGEDTMEALTPGLFLFVDETILCGPQGVALVGWMLARPGEIRKITLRAGAMVATLDPADFLQIDRPDVLASLARHGFDNPRCGFATFLPGNFPPQERLYIEVETSRDETGYYPLPPPRLTGMAAIRRLLDCTDIRFLELQPAFDKVLGPAVEALNTGRLASPPAAAVIDYGQVPANPRHSVIVPLYGRLDFVEYQMAFFSAHPGAQDIEYIYVLDEPARRREAQFLFTSVLERFQVPFRAILLDRNLGYAPANNIGLAHAHGDYIAYLNSDVFPGTPDWLETLTGRLQADPSIGVIGPLLMFEDGTVQHRGMYFSPLPEFAGWFFGQHHDKGMRFAGGDDLQYHISITGACMVVAAALARELGGLDERYIIGDFEDTDFCLKLQAMGLSCAIDPSVRLYHLERKSQTSAAHNWRMNLTAYNAWQHQRRWAETIAARQSA
jgi:GT2 family glycosyltransferase